MPIPRLAPLLYAFLSASLTAGIAQSQDRPVALIGATIMPVSCAPIKNGTVLLQAGKIKAVGANVAVPANARRIDVRGKVIIPGLIDAESSLFLSAEELNTAGAADRDVLDGVDLFDDASAKVLARGVTTVYLSPGRRGSITGVGAVVKLRATDAIATDPKPGYARVLKSRSALKATLGLSTNNRSSSLERLASYEALRSTFKGAQQYADSFARYDRALKRYELELKLPAEPVDDGSGDDPFGGGGQAPAGPQKPTKPRPVPSQEILVKALKREIPVRIEAHRADDIMNALRLADEFGFKLILERATDGQMVAAEIARRKVPVIWGPALMNGAPQLDSVDHSARSAGSLARAGVRLAIVTDGVTGLSSRFVLENAGAAAGYGLSVGDALRAVTLGAAEILGVGDRVGSLEIGKDADLVVLSAGPWDPRSRVEQVWIDGEAVRGGK